LIVKRSENIKLGGFYVFPGGILDALDFTMGSVYQTKPEVSPPLPGINSVDLSALKYCALRETYEETGILLGEPSAPIGYSFAGVCKELENYPRLSELQYFHRTLTPTIVPDKYDTTYFLTEVDPAVQVNLNLEECSQFEWTSPLAALNAYIKGTVKLMPPQVLSLYMLAHFSEIAKAKEALQQSAPMFEWPEVLPQEKLVCLTGDYRHSRTSDEVKEQRLENYLTLPTSSSKMRFYISPQLYPILRQAQHELRLVDGTLLQR
jgi:8-oxo-dGTP pyrophosphatase MutT (NUDIX family)